VRAAFADTLADLAAEDERIVLMTGDLGFTVLERFADRFPDRFFNAGVAEQNMLGMATGLAEGGYRPWVYSIATFASMRPYEFIRNGAVLHELPVRIVGVGAGFDYGLNGATHYALEDVALMRAQPGLVVAAPATDDQARAATRAVASLDGPAYLRLARTGPAVEGVGGGFELGRLDVIARGSSVAIVALGSMAGTAVAAARLLRDEGVQPSVAAVSSVVPFPADDLGELLRDVDVCVALEAHYRVGGLGSALAELIAETSLGCRLVRCGVAEVPRGHVGSQEYLEARAGLAAEDVAAAARGALVP
jgi:transketolase